MMAADLEPRGGGFIASSPTTLFEGDFNAGEVCAHYDVSSDGRFLMVRLAEGELNRDINVIVNWAAGVQ